MTMTVALDDTPVQPAAVDDTPALPQQTRSQKRQEEAERRAKEEKAAKEAEEREIREAEERATIHVQRPEQERQQAMVQAKDARMIKLEGQKAGSVFTKADPQHDCMGMYELVEGKEVNESGVWQMQMVKTQRVKNRTAVEHFIYYANNDKWTVGPRESMEAGKTAGWMSVREASTTALTPDRITEGWQVLVTGHEGMVDAQKVRAFDATAAKAAAKAAAATAKGSAKAAATTAAAAKAAAKAVKAAAENSSAKQMQVVIPEGSVPGTTIHVQTPAGAIIGFTIPEGYSAGMTITLALDDTPVQPAAVVQVLAVDDTPNSLQ
jgi:hypothetical protein